MVDSGLRVDTADWQRAATGLKTASKEVTAAINTSLRKVAVPVGKFVSVSAGADLPQRGGLGYAIAAAKPGVQIGSKRVTIRWNVREKWYLAQIDDGVLKHPVFGRKDSMVEQKVKPGSFRRPFDESAPLLRRELITNLETMLEGIATVS